MFYICSKLNLPQSCVLTIVEFKPSCNGHILQRFIKLHKLCDSPQEIVTCSIYFSRESRYFKMHTRILWGEWVHCGKKSLRVREKTKFFELPIRKVNLYEKHPMLFRAHWLALSMPIPLQAKGYKVLLRLISMHCFRWWEQSAPSFVFFSLLLRLYLLHLSVSSSEQNQTKKLV